jgi:arginyl-tRNA synthetase
MPKKGEGFNSINLASPKKCLNTIKDLKKKQGKIQINKHKLDITFNSERISSHIFCHQLTDNLVNSKTGRGYCNVKDGKKLRFLKHAHLNDKATKNNTLTRSRKCVTYTKYHIHAIKMRSLHNSISKGMHVSHRCHNPACFRKLHLVIEHEKNNQQRKGCIGWLLCEDCNKVWKLCKHDPCCFTFKLFSCCDQQNEETISLV